jgi:hypothetical protein
MRLTTTKFARAKLWLTTCFQFHRHLPVNARHVTSLAASLALSFCGLATLGQERPTAATHVGQERSVGETQSRVLFDRDAFFHDGPLPYWSNGYLVSTKTESFSPGTPNAILLGRNGSKSAEVSFWFPGSQRVLITSGAASRHGGVLVSGEADKADGTRAFFIAFANSNGEVTNVIQTGDFHPRKVCEAPDGSIWAFGGMMWDAVKRERLAGNVLRRFDLQKGETASFVPGSTFPPKMQADEASHIRCTGEAVFVYSSNPANTLIELPYKAEAPQVYDVSKPEGLEVITFAVTGSHEIYGGLAGLGADNGKGGMYMLALNQNARSGHWQPVKGAVGRFTDEATVSGVWGVDEGNLVISRGGDPAGITALHWVSVSPR